MTEPDGIQTAIQRSMLRVAVRNSARSVPLLTVAVVFIAWLGWDAGNGRAALATLALGLPVAVWRLVLGLKHRDTHSLAPERAHALELQLEANALLVGVMWVVATVFIYPTLRGTTATVYVVIVCGSVSMAAFFMSMAGRSFLLLTGMQLGSLAAVSLFSTQAYSLALAVLALLFGVTMTRATLEFRNTALRAVRNSLQADQASASLVRAKEAAEAANLARASSWQP